MAHSDPVPVETLEAVAKEIGLRLSGDAIDAYRAGKTPELATTLAVWGLGLDATSNPNEPLDLLAFPTGIWHHQIRQDGKVLEYARSASLGPNPADWQVQDVTRSPIAEKIEAALDWIDEKVYDDPLVRLLIVPAYYVHALWLKKDDRSQLLIVDKPQQYRRLEQNYLFSSKDFLQALASEPHASGSPS